MAKRRKTDDAPVMTVMTPGNAQETAGAAPSSPVEPSNATEAALGADFQPDAAQGSAAAASEALARAADEERQPPADAASSAAPTSSADADERKRELRRIRDARYRAKKAGKPDAPARKPGRPAGKATDAKPDAAPAARVYQTRVELAAENDRLKAQLTALQPTDGAQLDKLAKSLSTVVKATGELMARFRGPHWRFPEPEADGIGEAAAPCLAPYMGELEQYSPWLGLVAVLALSILPRIDQDKRDAANIKLGIGASVEPSPAPASAPAPAGPSFTPSPAVPPRRAEPSAAPTVLDAPTG